MGLFRALGRSPFVLIPLLALAISAFSLGIIEAPVLGKTLSAPAAVMQSQSADDHQQSISTEAFIRTELFFGTERANKPEVSDREFKNFLDLEVTPRFPDGLTVLKGFGQFREANNQIVQETSFVLILLYPSGAARESSKRIEEIRSLYKIQFEQESVLRADDPRPVRVSF